MLSLAIRTLLGWERNHFIRILKEFNEKLCTADLCIDVVSSMILNLYYIKVAFAYYMTYKALKEY